MDEFELFTEDEKNSMSYYACVGSSALMGMAVGRIVGLGGLGAGALVGLVIGLAACPHLKEPIKRKLFSSSPMTEGEVLNTVQTLHNYYGMNNMKGAIVKSGVWAVAYAATGSTAVPSIPSVK